MEEFASPIDTLRSVQFWIFVAAMGIGLGASRLLRHLLRTFAPAPAPAAAAAAPAAKKAK